MQRIMQSDIDNWFTYHSPSNYQLPAYAGIRDAGKFMATVILALTPSGPDQTAAIRKVREAVMTANAAIACQPEKAEEFIDILKHPDGSEEKLKRTDCGFGL